MRLIGSRTLTDSADHRDGTQSDFEKKEPIWTEWKSEAYYTRSLCDYTHSMLPAVVAKAFRSLIEVSKPRHNTNILKSKRPAIKSWVEQKLKMDSRWMVWLTDCWVLILLYWWVDFQGRSETLRFTGLERWKHKLCDTQFLSMSVSKLKKENTLIKLTDLLTSEKWKGAVPKRTTTTGIIFNNVLYFLRLSF